MWTIKPRECVGPVQLGARPDEYYSIMKGPPERFRRTSQSQETLAFDQDLLHMELAPSGTITCVSVFHPRELFLSGVQMLGRRVDDVAGDLLAAGVSVARVDAGLANKELGIVLVEIDGVIDGVEVHM